MSDSTERLRRLRDLMNKSENNIAAYIVPTDDAHQSEYLRDCDKRRAFLSGFTGSAGTAVVTADQAALWTDGRYFLQAEQQLDSNWKLMKARQPGVPEIWDWLNQTLPEASRVGIDPRLIAKGGVAAYERVFPARKNTLVPLFNNLVDEVWGDEQPPPPNQPAFAHPLKYSGESHTAKLARLREQLTAKGAHALVVSALDEIAWLFNIRGSDVECNPVVVAYAIVTADSATLYANESSFDKDVREHLGAEVTVRPYGSFFDDLAVLNKQPKKIWLDPAKSSWAIFSVVTPSLVHSEWSPITFWKSIKNPAELDGLRNCHIRDAAALVSYLSWLEERHEAGDTTLTECTGADHLESLRRQQADFVSLSFDSISGSGANGAIIHYKPEPETCAKLNKNEMYLIDSGGQYRDGTTDVTRTLHYGTPTKHEITAFTLVLQGHINLAMTVFPNGTTGKELDPIARLPLWSHGLDYRHGTGHGVGAFLNVHEGPQLISFRETPYAAPMKAGMTITNEPGYYEDGAFGIRIENVLIVNEVHPPHNFGNVGWLGFETITVVPYERRLIDVSMLTAAQIDWIDAYHRDCLAKVAPLLSGRALDYLKRCTQPLKP
eukprot:TRINITY_DN18570_c0_g1_i1.p1 TRINITY_DN18570_c0_g1~~TRINITY_DN18570_c0_g1_i1.p1  ORF type:complete len:643 (+),score=156.21 TRINITY_DN18570_c0_g1_i1:116-1930(+)